MNKKVIIIGLIVIFITVTFCGCFESEEQLLGSMFDDSGQKIEVSVDAGVTVLKREDIGVSPVSGVTVSFTIRKTGGETFSFNPVTDQTGMASCPRVGYNLYKSQKVTVETKISGDSDVRVLTYSTAYSSKTDENTFGWAPRITFYVD